MCVRAAAEGGQLTNYTAAVATHAGLCLYRYREHEPIRMCIRLLQLTARYVLYISPFRDTAAGGSGKTSATIDIIAAQPVTP